MLERKQLTKLAAGKHFCVVAAKWNKSFTDCMVQSALEAFSDCECGEVSVVRVPGSFELPHAVKRVVDSLSGEEGAKVDGVVALGVLFRGETDHYRLIAEEVSNGLSRVMLDSGVPVAFGVIAAHTKGQAFARAGKRVGNLGREAALACIEMASLSE